MKYCINHPQRKVFSKGLCAACYKIQNYKPLKRTPLKKRPFFIKPISNKRKKQLEAYKPKKEAFLAVHTFCELKGLYCQLIASEVHHTGGREGELLLDESKWKASCHNCHTRITEHSKKAIEDGHSISRHKK